MDLSIVNELVGSEPVSVTTIEGSDSKSSTVFGVNLNIPPTISNRGSLTAQEDCEFASSSTTLTPPKTTSLVRSGTDKFSGVTIPVGASF